MVYVMYDGRLYLLTKSSWRDLCQHMSKPNQAAERVLDGHVLQRGDWPNVIQRGTDGNWRCASDNVRFVDLIDWEPEHFAMEAKSYA